MIKNSLIMLISVLMVGCGVAKSEYEALQQQYESKQTDLQRAEGRISRLENDLQSSKAELQNIQDQKRTQEEFIKSLKTEIQQGNVTISRLKDKLTLNLVDKILFDSGSAQIKPEGKSLLDRVSRILARTEDKRILVNGHTDNVPIGPNIKDRFETNWELSTARATSVVRYLASQNVDEENLVAAGYSQFRPIADNDTPEGRQQNRRIEIVLVPQEIHIDR